MDFFGFFWNFWIFFGFFLDYLGFYEFFGILGFIEFLRFFLDFFVFFWFLSKLLRLLLNVTTVTTGHQKLPKIGKKSFFFLPQGQKKASAKGRSPPQELEVGPRSGLYLLVILKMVFLVGCLLDPFGGRGRMSAQGSLKEFQNLVQWHKLCGGLMGGAPKVCV